MTEIPGIVEHDPYLRPFLDKIRGRIWNLQETERKLLSGGLHNLSDFACGYLYFGLHFENEQWVFREWAPHAKQIYLVGEFSNWEVKPEYALHREGNNWIIYLPKITLKHGMLYRLHMCWEGGEAPRIPAWAARVVQDPQTLIFNAQVWMPEEPYIWKHPNYRNPHKVPLIYEAHVGMASEEGKVGSFREFKDKVLPHIKELGYTVIQFMAIQEHPYYGSFGYHVSSLFAVSSRFGTPVELKELIDAAHGMGISVIMDIVHSHAVKNEIEGLSRFDGSPYQFFHDGARGSHIAWDSRCYNYGKPEVLHFLLSNCKYWIDEYKFDGFRFDGVTSMLYLDHGLERDFTSYNMYYDGGQDEEAITYLGLANKLIHELRPDAITIAEEMSGMPGLAAPIELGGIGFNYRLAMGVPDYWIKLIKESQDEEWNVGHMFHELTSKRMDERTITYAESHDQALVGDKTIIFRLIDQDMYWDMHTKHENLRIDRGMSLHKMIRLITLACSGGGYLNFMGNEFGHPEWIDFPREGNNWSYHYARRQWSLVKNEDLRYKFLNAFDVAMINLMKNTNCLSELYIGKVLEHISDQVMVISRANLLFVFNFHPFKSYVDYIFEAPAGKYRMVLNTDSLNFGGHGRIVEEIEHHAMERKSPFYDYFELSLYIPNRTAFVLERIV
ncbi:MAG: alpha amylase C-terminal domain-containing protein [Leptospiraceae bacterium]|nr:alpha amylase C-terminal domain-containing protein [Leptospiraceae bacterium]MCP5501292.1 alpha amylase C-terminal domain-containing protein [Leptospiraceae bacterium]